MQPCLERSVRPSTAECSTWNVRESMRSIVEGWHLLGTVPALRIASPSSGEQSPNTVCAMTRLHPRRYLSC